MCCSRSDSVHCDERRSWVTALLASRRYERESGARVTIWCESVSASRGTRMTTCGPKALQRPAACPTYFRWCVPLREISPPRFQRERWYSVISLCLNRVWFNLLMSAIGRLFSSYDLLMHSHRYSSTFNLDPLLYYRIFFRVFSYDHNNNHHHPMFVCTSIIHFHVFYCISKG